jgi:hypothetical protein
MPCGEIGVEYLRDLALLPNQEVRRHIRTIAQIRRFGLKRGVLMGRIRGVDHDSAWLDASRA